jgi:predicted metal-binding protein
MRSKKKKHRKKSIASKTKISNRQLCDIVIVKSGVKEIKIISPADVETADWVRLKCQFGCDGFGQCLVCPPFTPTPQQMRKVLDCYSRAILIHFTPEAEIKATVAQLEREIFILGAWKALGLGAGPCYFCRSCPVEKGLCRYPERARPAMEACGIDVFTTAKKAGFPIEVIQTHRQCPNYYGLILVD